MEHLNIATKKVPSSLQSNQQDVLIYLSKLKHIQSILLVPDH